MALALAGYFMSSIEHEPSNTISAEPVTSIFPQDLRYYIHDTVRVGSDTIVKDSIVYRTKYKTKRVYHKVKERDTVEIPVLYMRAHGKRKEISPDSLLESNPKRVTREVIELRE